MKNLTLILAEPIFKSIQGEGPKSGVLSIFVRLAGCNLSCEFCDTKYTFLPEFKSRWIKIDISTIVNNILKIKESEKNLVITGGEPLLQKKGILNLLKNVNKHFNSIEIETNGTISPEELLEYSPFFNVSPKLSNSKISEEKRINNNLYKFAKYERSTFKFIVEKENDISEIFRIIEKFSIKKEKVFLMPMARTKMELEEKSTIALKLSIKYGFNYSDRLHIRFNIK